MERALRTKLSAGAALLMCGLYATAAQAQNQGFQLNRYEPTAAGEWSFAVDHPWYSGDSGRMFAAGLTLNYAHKPFVLGLLRGGSFTEQRDIVTHQFITHIDLAGSFLDRVLITGSLPVVWVTRSDQVDQGVAVGDPRLGITGRVYGQPYQDKLSVSFGINIWLPLRGFSEGLSANTASDQSARFLPRLIFAGVWQKLLWSGTFGFLVRPEAVAQVALPARRRVKRDAWGRNCSSVCRLRTGTARSVLPSGLSCCWQRRRWGGMRLRALAPAWNCCWPVTTTSRT